MSAAATLSTGPRTSEGKAISSKNARKHGLTSASPYIPDEQRPAYDALESELRNELHPERPGQELTFRQILANSWNLLRIEKMEAEAHDLDQLLKLQRYRTAAERGLQRARNELVKFQSTARSCAFNQRQSEFHDSLRQASTVEEVIKAISQYRQRSEQLETVLNDPWAALDAELEAELAADKEAKAAA